MATRLSGAPVNAAIHESLVHEIDTLSAHGIIPCLAIVRIGERGDDIAYETGATKRCEKLGVCVRHFTLPETAAPDALFATVDQINNDNAIHGCLLLRPLPKQFDEDAVCNRLLPKKDVDGITDASLAGVFTGSGRGFAPCTAQACMEILAHYEIGLTGKRVAVVGRSLVVGRPVAMLLMRQNATVTICHTRTEQLPSICRQADIVIAAAGCAGMIGADYVSAGQIVIDVGIHVLADGALKGDADFSSVEPLVGAITPVPGGVGTVTTTVLVKHTVEAAMQQSGVRL